MYIAPVADFDSYKKRKEKIMRLKLLNALLVGFVGGVIVQYKYNVIKHVLETDPQKLD